MKNSNAKIGCNVTLLRVALIIPTLNAGKNFATLLEQICEQDLQLAKKLVVDSESTDGTVDVAKNFGFEVLQVARKNFNHGTTRQFALEKVLREVEVDVVIFLTQDVLLHDEKSLSELVKIFAADESVGLTYGRQLPHVGATREARILREFNYPAESQLKTFADRKTLGLKAAFASDSFAAYKVEVLREVGGFPEVILCEDMFVAAKMLIAGYKIFYNAGAQVFHSHNYTAAQEFRRYFDIGVFHSRESWIRETFGSAEGAGKKFILHKYRQLNNPAEILGALFRDGAKFFGYRLGRLMEGKNLRLFPRSP